MRNPFRPCACAHYRDEHKASKGDTGPCKRCECKRFDDSVRPAATERLEFGAHRQRSPDAETARAWPPLRARS